MLYYFNIIHRTWKTNAINEPFSNVFPSTIDPNIEVKDDVFSANLWCLSLWGCAGHRHLSAPWIIKYSFWQHAFRLDYDPNNQSSSFWSDKIKILESWSWSSAEEGGDENAGVQVERCVPPAVGEIQHLTEKISRLLENYKNTTHFLADRRCES